MGGVLKLVMGARARGVIDYFHVATERNFESVYAKQKKLNQPQFLWDYTWGVVCEAHKLW